MVNRKWIAYLIIIVLGIALLFARNFKGKSVNSHKRSTGHASSAPRGPDFDRHASFLEYTKHARCRMQCRKISETEVEEILKNGIINYRKTDINDQPCPTYGLEGTTSDDQRIRIVFAQCDTKTRVVTCIDLETDWECHCPGDDDKYKNRN